MRTVAFFALFVLFGLTLCVAKKKPLILYDRVGTIVKQLPRHHDLQGSFTMTDGH